MVRRHELPDPAWEAVEPHLPTYATGRPRKDDRRVLNGIFWILRTGAPWRDLPERYGAWQTVYSRFRRWQHAGVWDRILAALQDQLEEQDAVDWGLFAYDGTNVRAHRHAAGARGEKSAGG